MNVFDRICYGLLAAKMHDRGTSLPILKMIQGLRLPCESKTKNKDRIII